MTGFRAPIHYTGTPSVCFGDLAVGDTLSDGLTITETHVVMAAAIFNDPGPNHLNALQAASNRFGRRIAHGPLLVGVMAGIIGNVLGSTIEALLEQSASFWHPVHPDDTVVGLWTVVETVPKPRFNGGGIVRFDGVARNQNGMDCVEMSMTLAVADHPLWEPGVAS